MNLSHTVMYLSGGVAHFQKLFIFFLSMNMVDSRIPSRLNLQLFLVNLVCSFAMFSDVWFKYVTTKFTKFSTSWLSWNGGLHVYEKLMSPVWETAMGLTIHVWGQLSLIPDNECIILYFKYLLYCMVPELYSLGPVMRLAMFTLFIRCYWWFLCRRTIR